MIDRIDNICQIDYVSINSIREMNFSLEDLLCLFYYIQTG